MKGFETLGRNKQARSSIPSASLLSSASFVSKGFIGYHLALIGQAEGIAVEEPADKRAKRGEGFRKIDESLSCNS